MKVLFIKTFKKDKLGSIKEVANGYAINFLIAKGYAIQAIEKNINMFNSNMAKKQELEDLEISKLMDIGIEISKTEITFLKKATPKGIVEGTITKTDIYSALKEKGIDVEQKNIEFKNTNIFGSYEVLIKLGKWSSSLLTVNMLR
jgi:large subunit ribosomal protein L9